MDTDPDQVPASSRYLLELDFSQLVDSGHEEQAYWVVAVQAAKKAGRRAWQRVQQMGGSARRMTRHKEQRRKVARGIHSIERVLTTIRRELGLEQEPSRQRSAEGKVSTTMRLQKRVKRPE